MEVKRKHPGGRPITRTDAEIRISKSGSRYKSYYRRKGRPISPNAEIRVSKSGRRYTNYYLRKFPQRGTGLLPASKLYRGPCLERDNFKCQICGATNNLDIHHKDNGGYHLQGQQTNNELNNLITLCHRCHLKMHKGVLGREEIIMSRREAGETIQSIANSFGVSRQRIHQIIKRVLYWRGIGL